MSSKTAINLLRNARALIQRYRNVIRDTGQQGQIDDYIIDDNIKTALDILEMTKQEPEKTRKHIEPIPEGARRL